jgi:predicted transcriptional regulator
MTETEFFELIDKHKAAELIGVDAEITKHPSIYSLAVTGEYRLRAIKALFKKVYLKSIKNQTDFQEGYICIDTLEDAKNILCLSSITPATLLQFSETAKTVTVY